MLALSPDGTSAGGNPRDSYTPANFQSLQNGDTDLGSTAPSILTVPAASHVPHLEAIWTDGNASSSPLVANNVLYYATSGELRALAPTTGGTPLWQGAIGGIHWESPIVANGTIYIADEIGHVTAFAPPNLPPPTNTPCSNVTITPVPTTVTGPFKSLLPLVPNVSCL